MPKQARVNLCLNHGIINDLVNLILTRTGARGEMVVPGHAGGNRGLPPEFSGQRTLLQGRRFAWPEAVHKPSESVDTCQSPSRYQKDSKGTKAEKCMMGSNLPSYFPWTPAERNCL